MDNGVVGSARFFLELDMQKFQDALKKSGTEFSGLVKNIGNMSDTITKDIDRINKKAEGMAGSFKFTELKSKIDLMKGAYVSLRNTVQEFVREYQTQIENENKLLALMKNRGDYTEQQYIKYLAFSNKMQATTNFSDDSILDAISQFQTFTKIRQDIVQEAVRASADIAATVGGDVKSVAIQLAKALDDPQYVSSLRRSGIMINEEHLKSLSTLEEQQRYILDEIKKQYAGAAEGARNSFKSMGNIISDLKESIGKNLMPVFEFISQGLQKSFERIKWVTEQVKSLVTVNTDVATSMKELRVATETYNQEMGKIGEMNVVINTYDELSKKTNLTAEEHNKLTDALKRMQSEMPLVITQLDAQGNALKANTQYARDYLELQKKSVLDTQKASVTEMLGAYKQAVQNQQNAENAKRTGMMSNYDETSGAGKFLRGATATFGRIMGVGEDTQNMFNMFDIGSKDANRFAQEMQKVITTMPGFIQILADSGYSLASMGNSGKDFIEILEKMIGQTSTHEAGLRMLNLTCEKFGITTDYINQLLGTNLTALTEQQKQFALTYETIIRKQIEQGQASEEQALKLYELAKAAGIATGSFESFFASLNAQIQAAKGVNVLLSELGISFDKITIKAKQQAQAQISDIHRIEQLKKIKAAGGELNALEQSEANRDLNQMWTAAKRTLQTGLIPIVPTAARPSTPSTLGQKVKEPKPEKVREIKPERLFDFLKKFGGYLERFNGSLEGLAKSLHDETKAFESAIGEGFKMAYSENAVIQASLTGDLQKIADNLNQQKIFAFMEKTGASYTESANKIVKVTTSELEIYAQRLQSVMREFQENFAQEVFMLGKGETFKKVSGINDNYDKMMQKFYQYEQTYKKVGGSITPEEMKRQIQQEYTRQRQEAIEESRSNIRKFYQDETTTKLEELRKQAEQLRKSAKDLSEAQIAEKIRQENEIAGASSHAFKKAIIAVQSATRTEDIPADIIRTGGRQDVTNGLNLKQQFDALYKFYLQQLKNENYKDYQKISQQIKNLQNETTLEGGRSRSDIDAELNRLEAQKAQSEGQLTQNAFNQAKLDLEGKIRQQLNLALGLAREGETYNQTRARINKAYQEQQKSELAFIQQRIAEQEKVQAELYKYDEWKKVKQAETEFASLMGDFFKASFQTFEIERRDTEQRADEYKRNATAYYNRKIAEVTMSLEDRSLSTEQKDVIVAQILELKRSRDGLAEFTQSVKDSAKAVQGLKSANAIVGFIDEFQKSGFTFAKEIKKVVNAISKDKSFGNIARQATNALSAAGDFVQNIGNKTGSLVIKEFVGFFGGIAKLPKAIWDSIDELIYGSRLEEQKAVNEQTAKALEYQLFLEGAIVRKLQDREEQLSLIDKLYSKDSDEKKKNALTEQTLTENINDLKLKYINQVTRATEEQTKQNILAKQKEKQAERENLKSHLAGLSFLQATINATDDDNKELKIAQLDWYKLIYNAQLQGIEQELNAYEQYADYEQQLYELKQAQNEELYKSLGLQLKISDEVLKQLKAINNTEINAIIAKMYAVEGQIKTGAIREGSAEALNTRKALLEQMSNILGQIGNTTLKKAVGYDTATYYNEADLKRFLSLAGTGSAVTFAQGGYTGAGAGIAGLVHQGEVVLNSDATQALSERLGIKPEYLQGALLASQGATQNIVIDGVNIIIQGNADKNTIRELENKLYDVLPKIMNRLGGKLRV